MKIGRKRNKEDKRKEDSKNIEEFWEHFFEGDDVLQRKAKFQRDLEAGCFSCPNCGTKDSIMEFGEWEHIRCENCGRGLTIQETSDYMAFQYALSQKKKSFWKRLRRS